MAGELVPLVMLPRYTTFTGEALPPNPPTDPDRRLTTMAMEVTDYKTAILNVWRGRIPPSTTLTLTCEESTDTETWTTCVGTNVANYDPGELAEGQVTATLSKRWFRIAATLTKSGSDEPRGTCWAVGFLERRKA